ncbi:MAG TPA: serine hydrolase [Polyangiaceae bacterium]|jgi:CubicO group peptidase (beta-lactamase class C family)|nr:serine hydrolase [Polyangiaceae bacterium]
MKSAVFLGIWTIGSLLPGCLFDEPLKHDLGVVPQPLDDGWEIATPESVGLSSDSLARIHEVLLSEDRFVGSLGMLVIKDGKLVWETYLRSLADRDHYHHLQSATKSVTALVFGIARDRGYFPTLSQGIVDLFPEELVGLDPLKGTISLQQLLTMTSGIAFDNLDFDLEMYTFHHADPLRYILEKPLYAAPGVRYYYRNADPQLISYALQRRTGTSESALAASWLFSQLGISDWYWQADSDDGVTIAGNSLHLKPRDFAKIGQLVLNQGQWAGRTVVSKDWVEQMTQSQIQSDFHDANGLPIPYGYYWYVLPNGFAAWGNGGQYLLVDPAKQLVIVHIALPDTAGLDGSQLNQFVELVHELL